MLEPQGVEISKLSIANHRHQDDELISQQHNKRTDNPIRAWQNRANTLHGQGNTMLKPREHVIQPTHWGAVDELVNRWLQERQELILLYCATDGLREFTPRETPIDIKIQALCNVLIDYASAGHFEVYHELMQEAAEFDEDYTEFTGGILPRIQESTNCIVDFNEKYAGADLIEEDMPNLAHDLSVLGEKLVERFDLEDQLIEVLHNRHRELVA
jgi:regulator of sigma D